jgi:hypothetical protein
MLHTIRTTWPSFMSLEKQRWGIDRCSTHDKYYLNDSMRRPRPRFQKRCPYRSSVFRPLQTAMGGMKAVGIRHKTQYLRLLHCPFGQEWLPRLERASRKAMSTEIEILSFGKIFASKKLNLPLYFVCTGKGGKDQTTNFR